MIGMLWFDNDSKTPLAAKIEKALAYYVKKYGSKAEICLVSMKDAQGVDLEETSQAVKLTVKAVRAVLPSHLVIGNEEFLPLVPGGEQ